MKKTLTLFFMLLATLNGYSQFSKIHYIPPITSANSTKAGSGAAISTDPDVNQYIYISTPSTTPVTVTITPIGGTSITRTITNATPWEYIITTAPSVLNGSTLSSGGVLSLPKYGFDNQLFVPYSLTGTVQRNKGFLIEASDLVYTNVRVSSRVSGSIPKSSQVGSLVSKGLSAYGTEFRIGGFENVSALNNSNYGSLVNFASFIATEDNTTVTITLPRAVSGQTTFHNGTKYTGPITVTLNKNESYVFAIPNTSSSSFDSNIMLGGLIQSDRNIVVNCGSIAGNSQTNLSDTMPNKLPFNTAGKDYGFDQIVGADKVGKEYIFIGGAGMIPTAKAYDLERAIIIANVNNTQVFKNGGPTPVATLNAGEYYVFNGNDFNGSASTGYNLYVATSEKVFAYQCIAGENDAAAQNMFFVPPLNCATPSVVNNIPLIERVGTVIYPNTVINITTEFTPTDPTPTVMSSNLGAVQLNGANCLRNVVTGKPGFVTYTYPKPDGTAPTGNISVTAPKQLYVSYYGSNETATYGSYFSGFDTKPNIVVTSPTPGTACISNTVLKVTSLSPTDIFQWNHNNVPISGATESSYTPTSIAAGGKGPGYYSVVKISACTNTMSDPIVVSECSADIDNDGVNNNIDIDNDNDGIVNTTESYGDKNIDISGSAGTLAVGTYSNSYTSTLTPIGTGNTFTGATNGSFTSSLAAGTTNALTYTLNFTKAVSLGLRYNLLLEPTAVSLTNAAFQIKSDADKTITVSNPTNQLLIDTDNDGIYESGVTQFSSFDIKFKLNPSVLAPATGLAPAVDFKFQTYLSNSISFTHKNLSGSLPNNANFNFYAISVSKDSDGDTIPDQLDADSDADGILDIQEGQIGNKIIALPLTDANKNGLSDSFEPILATVDTDMDNVADYLDLDSDNDGILDAVEGSVDTDSDGTKNYRDKDSDGDTCNDVVEAGFTDADGDGILGISPVVVDVNGKVIGGTYTTPSGNYLVAGVPVITAEPIVTSDCATQSATIKITDNGGNNYKWEVSTDGILWNVVTNNATYSGATTNTLAIAGATNGYQYRAILTNSASACRSLLSNAITLMLSSAPIANNVVMELCGKDLSGIAFFDLTAKNSQISSSSFMETFSYYTSQAGANTANPSELISNPTAYMNSIPYSMDVWVRVANPSGCFSVAKITLNVEVLVANPVAPYTSCDDNNDGKFAFNTSILEAILLGGQTNKTVTYFDQNGLPLPSPFPATFVTSTQTIKAVVTNNTAQSCSAETFIQFIVNPLPSNSVIVTGSDLTAIQIGANYQWYKCPNTLLDGETNQSYTPTAAGDYKVEITSKLVGCSVTSDCVTFSTLGVKDVNADSKLVLYPNPTTGILNIESNIEDTFTVVNQLGQVVKIVKVNVGANKVNLENLVDGVYFLKNKSNENQVVKKIIKQ